jgi:hypothetical protein
VRIRSAIESGALSANAAESTFGLEALDRHARIDQYFRAWASRSTSKALPAPEQIRSSILTKALALGIRVMHVPRIALATFVGVPDYAWAVDELYSPDARQTRTFTVMDTYSSSGPAALKKLGASLAILHQLDTSSVPLLPGFPAPEEFFWLQGIVAEYDSPRQFASPEKVSRAIRELIAEWCDVDAIAATYGYGIQYFCTADRASNSGSVAILHPSNASGLRSSLSIEIVSPDQFAALL